MRTSVLQPRPATGGSGPVVTPIASITPYQNKWTIKARVTSKGDVRTWNKSTGSGKLFSMDLMDESGAIRVTAFKEMCDKFYDYAEVGKVGWRYLVLPMIIIGPMCTWGPIIG